MIGWARSSRGHNRHAFQAESMLGRKWRRAMCQKWFPVLDLNDDNESPRCRACVQAIDRLDKLVRGKRQY